MGSAQNWVSFTPTIPAGSQYYATLPFPTFEDGLPEGTESFKIHLRVAGSTEAFVLEADILDGNFASVHTIRYAYDAFDKLVRRSEDADGVGSAPATDRFFSWENGQIALQFDSPTATHPSHRYLYGPAVDQILADEQVSSPTQAGTVLWPLTDHLGSVRDIAQRDTLNNVTNLVNHRNYDAFGNLISETHPEVAHLVGYAGGIYEVSTDYYYFRARWLDPKMGKWLSEDPSGFFLANDANLYRYVRNESTMYTDPSGLAPPEGPSIGAPPGYVHDPELSGDREWVLRQLAMRRFLLEYYRASDSDFKSASQWLVSDEQEIKDARPSTMEHAMRTIGLTMCIRRADRTVARIDGILSLGSGAAASAKGTPRPIYVPGMTPAHGPLVTASRSRSPSRDPGPFRGGRHGDTKLPVGDKLESHHMPANSVYGKDDYGPAIQMERHDHLKTSSHGSRVGSGVYRAQIADLLSQGNRRKAMAKEIQDVRRAAQEGSGNQRKYNNAVREMLQYARESNCLR